jgi:hypothetical protein
VGLAQDASFGIDGDRHSCKGCFSPEVEGRDGDETWRVRLANLGQPKPSVAAGRTDGLPLSVMLWSVGETPAQGACSDEETIFAKRPNDSANYGTKNEIKIRDRLPSQQSCSQHEAWSTAHIEPGPISGDGVEIGWKETFLPDETTHQWKVFTESFVGNNTICNSDSYAYVNSHIQVGNFYNFRVSNVPGTNIKWDLLIDLEDGNGYRLLDTCANAGGSHGKARGETGRRGGSSVGLRDTQQSLHWKNSSGDWSQWPDVVCDDDPIAGWEFNKTTDHSYEIQSGSGDCSFNPP